MLQRAEDEELACYLLQLTAALRYEPSHDSRLARFLVDRCALQNVHIAGIDSPQQPTQLGSLVVRATMKLISQCECIFMHRRLVRTKIPTGVVLSCCNAIRPEKVPNKQRHLLLTRLAAGRRTTGAWARRCTGCCTRSGRTRCLGRGCSTFTSPSRPPPRPPR